jgi:oligosaccharide repeat unit polymerase
MILSGSLASISTVTAIIAMTGLAITGYYFHRTWLQPGNFFSLFWLLLTLIPFLIAPENPAYPFGIWYIFSFTLALLLGSLVWPFIDPSTRLGKALTVATKLDRYAKTLLQLLSVFIILSFMGVVLLLLYGINRYGLDVNIFSLSTLPNLYYVDRDTGIFTLPWAVKGFMYFAYVASLSGGSAILFAKGKMKLICLLPLLIALLQGTILAVRSGFLLSIVLWLSGWLAVKVLVNDLKFQPRTVVISLIGFSLFIFLFISVRWLRSGADDPFLILYLLENVRISMFGHISAFSTWMRDYHYTGLSFGSNTFSGPLDLIGIQEREIGYYKRDVFLSSSLYTNIYTVFRGLLQDFSIPGTLVVAFGSGMAARISFDRCLHGKFIWLIPLSLFYAFTMYSPIISIFNYTSVVMAWCIFFVVLLLLNKKLIL